MDGGRKKEKKGPREKIPFLSLKINSKPDFPRRTNSVKDTSNQMSRSKVQVLVAK
jgi:hypothetical protein